MRSSFEELDHLEPLDFFVHHLKDGLERLRGYLARKSEMMIYQSNKNKSLEAQQDGDKI